MGSREIENTGCEWSSGREATQTGGRKTKGETRRRVRRKDAERVGRLGVESTGNDPTKATSLIERTTPVTGRPEGAKNRKVEAIEGAENRKVEATERAENWVEATERLAGPW